MTYSYRIGADENGLGASLGPLVVTAVMAKLDERGHAQMKRALPRGLRADLDDSKRLVSHADFALGEAWARALVTKQCDSPSALLSELSLDGGPYLTEPCPKHALMQCWSVESEQFVAEPKLLRRIEKQRQRLADRGIEVTAVKCVVTCTRRLNQARAAGLNRFTSDLHAMERLILFLRQQTAQNVLAVCGKVGGMNEYSKFFGPLAGQLHAILEQGRKQSSYHFPEIGELRFVRDADACDPLVMLASLVGKFVRELMMARIGRFYPDASEESLPSGYHDPKTRRFIKATALSRTKRRIPITCFQRASDSGPSANAAAR